MDPNPKSFPILTYVMSRLNSSKSLSRSTTQDYGIEQPQIQHHRRPPQLSIELIDHLPHLSDPTILASMKSSVAELAQTRSVLQTLDRPDHETLDLAKSLLVEIDAVLSKNLEEIILANRPHDVDVKSWREIQVEREKECRAKAEKEKAGYKAVVQLDEMHEAYERLLREAEEKLVRIYEGHDYGKVEEDDKEKKAEVNEEVVGILNEVAWKCVERVQLSERELWILPEAFGRMRGLVLLDVSNNQLETIPDSIAGLERLEELRVSSNLLVSLPDSIGLLLNLKILDVSGNKLKALPDSISKYS